MAKKAVTSTDLSKLYPGYGLASLLIGTFSLVPGLGIFPPLVLLPFVALFLGLFALVKSRGKNGAIGTSISLLSIVTSSFFWWAMDCKLYPFMPNQTFSECFVNTNKFPLSKKTGIDHD